MVCDLLNLIYMGQGLWSSSLIYRPRSGAIQAYLPCLSLRHDPLRVSSRRLYMIPEPVGGRGEKERDLPQNGAQEKVDRANADSPRFKVPLNHISEEQHAPMSATETRLCGMP